jgi:hypothetical protein
MIICYEIEPKEAAKQLVMQRGKVMLIDELSSFPMISFFFDFQCFHIDSPKYSSSSLVAALSLPSLMNTEDKGTMTTAE